MEMKLDPVPRLGRSFGREGNGRFRRLIIWPEAFPYRVRIF